MYLYAPAPAAASPARRARAAGPNCCQSMDYAQLLGAAAAGALGMALCSRSSLPPIASNADHPIVLLARVKLKPGKREAFLKFAKPLNVAEQHAKPGTLVFTLNADPDNASLMTWTEVYKNDQAWNDHLDMQSESPELIAQFARCDVFHCRISA